MSDGFRLQLLSTEELSWDPNPELPVQLDIRGLYTESVDGKRGYGSA